MRETITKILTTSAKSLGIVALFVLFAGAAFGVGYLVTNSSSYDPPASPRIDYGQPIAVNLPDEGVAGPIAGLPSRGLLLVDASHRNAFTAAELAAFRSLITARGYDVEFLGSFTSMDVPDRVALLDEKLRSADALMVVVPRFPYHDAETDLVERFVEKGGKLLLVADPSRPNNMNTLSERFGVNFQPDYLYNQSEYDLNFQNIFVRDFQPEELTSGVNAIALYTSGSIQTAGSGVAFTDSNTASSLVATRSGLSPIAWGASRNVLAVGDFTFMIPPQSSILDNGQMLSNIADFATTSSREFELADFPHFLDGGADTDVDIVVGQSAPIGGGTAMKNGLAAYGITSRLSSAEDLSRNTVFLGLHQDAPQVAGYLQAAGVRVDNSLGGPFATDLALEGTVVTLLDANRDRHVLIILADTPENLENVVARLADGKFRQDLVTDYVSVTTIAPKSK